MLAISPSQRNRGIINSSMYNQKSIMRTMELILGMRPMAHYDAGARPLITAFAATPNNAPYKAEPPRISLTMKNPAPRKPPRAPRRWILMTPSEIDDDELNADSVDRDQRHGASGPGAELFFSEDISPLAHKSVRKHGTCSACSRARFRMCAERNRDRQEAEQVRNDADSRAHRWVPEEFHAISP